MSERVRGRVKWFAGVYGFATSDEFEGDALIHWSEIRGMDGYKRLEEGEEVTFILERRAQGLCAREVVKL